MKIPKQVLKRTFLLIFFGASFLILPSTSSDFDALLEEFNNFQQEEIERQKGQSNLQTHGTLELIQGKSGKESGRRKLVQKGLISRSI